MGKWLTTWHSAFVATGARTRVLTPGADASPSRHAIRVHDALWATPFVGIADVIRQTRAGAYSVLLLAKGVRTAGRWCAGGGPRLVLFQLKREINGTPCSERTLAFN